MEQVLLSSTCRQWLSRVQAPAPRLVPAVGPRPAGERSLIHVTCTHSPSSSLPACQACECSLIQPTAPAAETIPVNRGPAEHACGSTHDALHATLPTLASRVVLVPAGLLAGHHTLGRRHASQDHLDSVTSMRDQLGLPSTAPPGPKWVNNGTPVRQRDGSTHVEVATCLPQLLNRRSVRRLGWPSVSERVPRGVRHQLRELRVVHQESLLGLADKGSAGCTVASEGLLAGGGRAASVATSE